jgi:hypothetical protein
MLSILSILIGIVFVLFLFSMLASTCLELLDAVFSLRGRHLHKTLGHMLGDNLSKFFEHPIYKQLAYASNNKAVLSSNRLPGWISRETFSAIVMDILKAKNIKDIQHKIGGMDEGDAKKLLQFLLDQAGNDVVSFQNKMEKWFDEIMSRATEWYRQNTKRWLLGIGVALAAIFNVDTIQIYQSLSLNATARDNLVLEAEKFVATRDSIAVIKIGGNDVQLKKAEFDSLLHTYQTIVQSPLGLGWDSVETNRTLPWWLVKIAGLLLTGLAVTLGAPFWFDILKKLIALRQPSGGSSAPASPAEVGTIERKAEKEAPLVQPPAASERSNPVG